MSNIKNLRYLSLIIVLLTIIQGESFSLLKNNLTYLNYGKQLFRLNDEYNSNAIISLFANYTSSHEVASTISSHSFLEQGENLETDQAGTRSDFVAGVYKLWQGEFSASRGALKRYISKYGDPTGVAVLYLGLGYELDGERDVAIKIWQQAPQIPQLFLRVGKQALNIGDQILVANRLFYLGLILDPADCELYYYHGISLSMIKDVTNAHQALSEAENLDCNPAILGEIYFLRAKLLSKSGRREEAITDVRKSLELQRGVDRMVFLADLLSQNRGNMNEALTLLEEALNTAPNNVWPYVESCDIYRRDKNYQEGLYWCQLALEKFPQNPYSSYYIGLLYLDLGEYHKAIQWLKNALTLDRENINTWLQLGNAYYKAGRVDSAIDTYQTVLLMDPENDYAIQRIKELSEDP